MAAAKESKPTGRSRGTRAASAPPGPAPVRARAAARGAAGRRAASETRPTGDGLADAFGEALRQLPSVGIPADRLAALQREYVERWQKLLANAAEHATPGLPDKRFADESWHDNGPFTWAAALYLLNSEFMLRLANATEGDRKFRERVRFATQQWVDMMSPSNFLATNPEAQRKLLETRGDSLRAGIENLLADLQRGRMSQTDEEAFEIGRNVATSPGAVVFQNELFQLLQYVPSTPAVAARPLLLVPPCINKYYILDLQPDGSFVANAVAHGHTVFLVSWRNVGPEQGHLTWDDYLEKGMFEALRVVREISGSETLNTLGFCVGGTILATALAALAARGERPAATMTMMTSLLDFGDPGVLQVFVDEASVRFREQTIGDGGLLAGKDLATTFSFLRPNDLVWNYYVANYLKGEQPPAFDLLYWNADSTNLPGPMYCWYLRHMYLQNDLRVPDRLVCAGQPIDLRRIGVPSYVFGAREDHIVPWRAAYESARLLAGPVRFVLGASGHIAGSINPASKNRRSYWVGEPPRAEADAWLARAEERPGSWWNDWIAWLEPHKGGTKAAPAKLGSRAHPPLEPAPGSYVKVRAA